VTVTGRFFYRDRSFDPDGFTHAVPGENPILPVRRAEVELLRGGVPLGASGRTADDGSFSFSITEQGSGDYQVRVKSRLSAEVSAGLQVLASKASPTLYTAITDGASSPGAGGRIDFGDRVVEIGAGGEAFNILDACLRGADMVAILDGAPPASSVRVFWNAASTVGTFYSRSDRAINLLAYDAYDDTVIIHEYGHYVMHQYSKDESPGGLHFIDDSSQDPRLSWSEGWASYWQALTRDLSGDAFPSWYVDVEFDAASGSEVLLISYDCEGPSLAVAGSASEVAVQALLWDIGDGPSTPDPFPGTDDDPLEVNPVAVWKTVTGPMKTATNITLEDFWEGWFDPSVANGFEPEMRETFAALQVELFPDASEPDEPLSRAGMLPLDGTPVHHTFYPAADEDWHRFELRAGDRVTVETLNLMGATDTILEILAPDLTVVGTSDDQGAGDFSSIVSFTAAVGGVYGAHVRRGFSGVASRTEFGSYDIRAVRGIPNGIVLTSTAGAAGLANTGFGVGAAFADYDSDGRPDLYVVNNAAGASSGGDKDLLYRNAGNGTFVVSTGAAGLGTREGGIAAAWADADNDGDPDVFVTDHGFFRNDGDGTFTDITDASGILDLGREFDAAWADVDRDGRLDLFVALRDRPSALWHQNADGTFTDVAPQAGFTFSESGDETYSCAFGDYNGDGLEDLLVTFLGPRGQALFRNLGENRFAEVTAEAGLTAADASVGGLWADFNGDGRLDIYICSTSRNKLYLNRGDGTFSDEASRYGVNDAGASRGASTADYDLDGDPDLYVVNFNGTDVLYENLGNSMLRVPGSGAGFGFGHSCTWADVDGDGDPDLFSARQLQENLLLRNQRNDGAETGSWLKVKLRGLVSNRDGIGARISLFADGTVQVREVGTGAGWAAKSRLPELFGIPGEGTVDSVRVDWPSGAFNILRAPAAGTVLTIVEDETTPVRPPGIPEPFTARLGPPFPNPFAGATSVRFTLTRPAAVRLGIFDLQGRRVRTLLDGRLPAGEHVAGWDGADSRGRVTAPGVYFYRLETRGPKGVGGIQVRKLVRIGG